jgi:hypothetical protein
MDNRNTFERQLADEIDYEVGPPQTVDALAITRQAKSTSPRWRFIDMSSTIKFAAAGSILAVAGAAFLLVAPGGPTSEDGVVAPPGAEQQEPAEPSTPTLVVGTLDDNAAVDNGAVTEGIRLEMDDPRVTGTATVATNVNTHEGSGFSQTWVLGQALRIENEAGWWSGQGTGVEHTGGTANPEESLRLETWPQLTGAGDYEGLSAYLIVDYSQNPPTIEGVIYEGEPPSFPEVPTE